MSVTSSADHSFRSAQLIIHFCKSGTGIVQYFSLGFFWPVAEYLLHWLSGVLSLQLTHKCNKYQDEHQKKSLVVFRALWLLLLPNATLTSVTQMAEFTTLHSCRKLALGRESQGHIFTKCRISMPRTVGTSTPLSDLCVFCHFSLLLTFLKFLFSESTLCLKLLGQRGRKHGLH